MDSKDKNGLKLENIGPNFSSCNANLLATLTPHYSPINPLSPKTDKHQFSPYIISMQSSEEVMRIDKMIQRKNAQIAFHIPPTNSVKKCIEISFENLYEDIAA